MKRLQFWVIYKPPEGNLYFWGAAGCWLKRSEFEIEKGELW